MAHPTREGLSQEQGALTILATSHLTDLEKRGVTAQTLADYEAKVKAMEDAVNVHTGKTSDKEQLTATELTAKAELLADVRRIQQGAKRTFSKGSPQLKEFYVGDKYNNSTALLVAWASGITAAWNKYKADLISEGKLIQEDVDTMNANAAILSSENSTQENAKRVGSPKATAAALQAMDDVEKVADSIYGAAEAEYAKNPQVLGDFEKLKPLRYSVDRPPKGPVPPPADTPK